jgi:hypothetical protein
MGGSKLMMLSGGIVDAGGGRPAGVSAYVVLSEGAGSRIFKVKGSEGAEAVSEFGAATTLDLKRFQREVEEDLKPMVERIRQAGGNAHIAKAATAWVCGLVRQHLKKVEGLEVE